ncbi:MAG: iron-sulfur cluster carrier protein [Metallosphaera javensis (ex Sakai et al. 2022)]|nr:MAG: iron-sulfur cluster carrier protein [Metallosphaera javensis (ex Sakai et al. 2022)]
MSRSPTRIAMLGIKGGVGKSTLAALIARELALMDKKVLIIDKDLLGISSTIFGLREKGIVAKVVSGHSGFHCELNSSSFISHYSM